MTLQTTLLELSRVPGWKDQRQIRRDL